MSARRAARARDVDAAEVSLTWNGDGTFALRAGGARRARVRLVLGRPLLSPDAFATVLSEAGEDLGVIWNLERLADGSRAAIARMRAAHDLSARIVRVRSLAYQFGSSHWDVDTDKGRRDFVIRGTSEHVRWLSDDRLLVTDVDGSRFEIESLSRLDRRSRALIHRIL